MKAKTILIKSCETLKAYNAINECSSTSMPFPIQRTFKITKEGRCEMFFSEHYHSRSQDLKEAYQDAGQFYWSKLGKNSSEIMFGKDSIPIVLPRHLVQDIDTLEDWTRAELMYQSLHRNRYNKWSTLKQKINTKKPIKFRQGEIYFMSVGHNIGYEIYGHGNLFLRPVLVYRKLTQSSFIGIPLTSQEKDGSYFFTFRYTNKRLSTALLNQLRVFDMKRHAYFDGRIKISDFKKLERKVIDLMKVTPHKGKFGHASKKLPNDLNTEIKNSIAKEEKNVK